MSNIEQVTAEEVGRVVSDKMDSMSADPLRLISERDVIERLRRRYRSTSREARNLLWRVMREHPLVMIKVSAKGHHISQLKPAPPTDDGPRDWWDVPEDAEGEAVSNCEITVDRTGLIRGAWELQDGMEAAEEDSIWLTTAARFGRLTGKIQSWTAEKAVERTAAYVVTGAAIDISSGEDIDQIAGLLWLAGVEDHQAIWPRISEGEVHLDVQLDTPEAIAAVAAMLRKAGFPTDTTWRKFRW